MDNDKATEWNWETGNWKLWNIFWDMLGRRYALWIIWIHRWFEIFQISFANISPNITLANFSISCHYVAFTVRNLVLVVVFVLKIVLLPQEHENNRNTWDMRTRYLTEPAPTHMWMWSKDLFNEHFKRACW